MDCCLWFNRKKIGSVADAIENFDLPAVRGYYLGGSLSKWLREHGGAVYADRLDTLDPKDPLLNDRLAEVFSIKAAPATEVFCGKVAGVCCGDCGGSYRAGSFGGSFSSGSFRVGSFRSGSGLGRFTSFGSFRSHMWEWEWEWRFGNRSGSFRTGSFSFGSYLFGSGSYLLGSFGSFSRGSLSGSFGAGSGSFGGLGFNGVMTADEYDRIMYECLKKCPLNCYGYGMHIV